MRAAVQTGYPRAQFDCRVLHILSVGVRIANAYDWQAHEIFYNNPDHQARKG